MTFEHTTTDTEFQPNQILPLQPHSPEWSVAFPVLQELRPDLILEAFREMYAAAQRENLHYAAMLSPQAKCVAVTGWRIMNRTVGRLLYVDDLVVAETARGHGHGAVVMKWLGNQAVEAGCGGITLDTGLQRLQAQGFYEGIGMQKVAVVYHQPSYL